MDCYMKAQIIDEENLKIKTILPLHTTVEVMSYCEVIT